VAAVAWPVVFASGGPRERGRAYGEQASGRVAATIACYDEIFRHYAGIPWREVRSTAEAFVGDIERHDAEVLPELEGIAEGAGVDAEDVLAINLRTEIMFGLDARPGHAALKECTALCVTSEASQSASPLVAQNWDWKPAARDTCVVLTSAPHRGPGFVTLVEAGLLAKCGMNEAGIAVATNALTSSRDRGRPGVPYHVILRGLLRASGLDEAIDLVRRGPRASSANYLLAERSGRAVDIEVTPGGPGEARVTEGRRLVHANHFLWPTPRPFRDVGRVDGDDSLRRQERGERAIAEGPVGVQAVMEALRDHEGRPSSVCAHDDPTLAPVEDYVTVASMVADPRAGVLWISHGNPCERAHEPIDVAEMIERARAGAWSSAPASGTS